MQKRTKLAIFILVALLLLALGLYFLLSPFLSKPAAQPPDLPVSGTPQFPAGASQIPEGVATGTPPIPEDLSDEARLHMLENRARSILERLGSGSSQTGFLGYTDVLLDLTPAGRTYALAEQKKLQAAHPASGPVYGVSIVTVSAHAQQTTWGDSQIKIELQAIQKEDSGNPNDPQRVTGKLVTITFVKQDDGSYLAESFVWSDVAL
jgi:hypothetical protein